jgi:hypothetical protein
MNFLKIRGREIIPLLLSLAVRKVNSFFWCISELVAVVKGDGVCAAVIRQKCGKRTGQK